VTDLSPSSSSSSTTTTPTPAREAPYFPFGRDTSDALAGLVYFPTILLAHLASGGSGCFADAPFSASVGTCSTLIYSHGMGGNADMGAYAMRRLAAQGIIVVALEHQDGSANYARDEDGHRVPFDGGRGKGFSHRVDEVLGAARTIRMSLTGDVVRGTIWAGNLIRQQQRGQQQQQLQKQQKQKQQQQQSISSINQ